LIRHLLALALLAATPARAAFTLAQMHAYPYTSELVAATRADRIAWVRTLRGIRNIWVADGPAFVPRQVTHYTDDDGMELSNLVLSPDGSALAFVRGGDHDSNWPSPTEPNPAGLNAQPKVTLYVADPSGRAPQVKIDEGDAPALSAKGVLAYVKDHAVWTAGLTGQTPHRLFFDRGHDGALAWSPDGARLAFVSNRSDHSFVGVYTSSATPLTWLSPSTGYDADPVWSPDSTRIAFTRRPGDGGPPEPFLTQVPHPWSIWTASVASGAGARVWASPNTLYGSFPETAGGANLHWAGRDRLTFTADLDGWPHLYAVAAGRGEPKLLTPGAFMVEHVAAAPDGTAVAYSANTGAAPGDEDRRHLFLLSLTNDRTLQLTSGDGGEWAPVSMPNGIAFVASNPNRPPTVSILTLDPKRDGPRELSGQSAPSEFPGKQFVAPRQITFRSEDGLTIHGQLFATPGGGPRKPALIFVHGGPPRQMLLGWHYMDYYSHAYAMNQYLAAHGYVVLSVNYRLGVGYGHDFHHPNGAGPAGAAEYKDVLAAARWLQARPEVDPARLGIWGGSYGGYLTGLALARNSDIFKAGVDLHGVHDWSRLLAEEVPSTPNRYEQGDRAKLNAVAWASSPVADIATLTSPVLLIHGDDDRNVRFNQTIDLARRLDAKGVAYEELILPDETHGFLREADWLKADRAMIDFLSRKLGGAND